MPGAKPIRSLPLQAQAAVPGGQPNLAVNRSEDSTLCLSTRGNLGVNNTESPSPACVLYSLTVPTLGLTTKREGERVSGTRASLVNRSRDCPERGPEASTTDVVSRRTRAPTASATGAPGDRDPSDSGLMRSGSPDDTHFEPRDRRVNGQRAVGTPIRMLDSASPEAPGASRPRAINPGTRWTTARSLAGRPDMGCSKYTL